MSTKKTFTKVIVSGIVVAVLIVVYVCGFIYIYDMRQKTTGLLSDIATEQQSDNQQLSLQALANNTAPDLTTLSNVIIPKDGDIDFIKNLETLGNSQPVSFQIVSASEVDGDAFTNLSFEVTAQGNWSEMFFACSISSNPCLTRFQWRAWRSIS